MNRIAARFLRLTTTLATLTASLTAAADPASPPAPARDTPVTSTVESHRPTERRTSATIELSPLSLGIGQLSIASAVRLTDYGALTVGLHWGGAMTTPRGGSTRLVRRGGGEVGYRHVFGEEFSGLFLGGSLMLDTVAHKGFFDSMDDVKGTPYAGGAIDFGGQIARQGGLFASAGIGVQYMAPLASPGATTYYFPTPIHQRGLAPRVLFAIGFAI